MLPAVVAILIAIIAGGVLLYFFYLRKPAKKPQQPWIAPQTKVSAPPPVFTGPSVSARPPEDEVEITEEELASLKDIPTLKSELSAIKALLQRLEGEVEPEREPEPPPEEWEELEVKPGLILKMRKNGHATAQPEPPPAPKETPAERMARARAVAAKNREAKKAQEGP